MEIFTINMGAYDVRVTRKRVKNINFRIGPHGEALMSIPLHVSHAEAERIAREHASWFERALTRSQARKGEAPVQWGTGEKLNVWGRPVTLRVLPPSETSAPCELRDNELLVRDGPSAAWRSHEVENWLQQELMGYLNDILLDRELAIGRTPTHITIRRMKTRWGSCTPSTGRIRMNTALAECPHACANTVLVHELCHLIAHDHGPRFQALMDLHCPGWRVTQRWLDDHPPRAL